MSNTLLDRPAAPPAVSGRPRTPTPLPPRPPSPGRPPPRSDPRKAAADHRADIQGLRAVAVLLVVFAHAGVGLVAGGYVGVDVFFVLSGFLITGLLLAETRTNGSVSLIDFYVRRARRILPAAALTLVVTDVAALSLLNFVRARETVVDGLHAAGFTANFHFAAQSVDYFAREAPPSPILHYWSLSVEEQFYLVWPLLLSLALFGVAVYRRRRTATPPHTRRLLGTVVLLASVSLAWSIYLTATAPTTAYFSPLTRAWELGLGAAIAVGASTIGRTPTAAKVVMGWAGLAAVAYSAVMFSDATPFPGAFALVPTIGTALAIVAGIGGRTPRFSVGRILSVRPMRIIGDRSYAFYLWHWPVLIIAYEYVGHDLGVGVKLTLMAAAFVISCVSYTFVENPIRRKIRSRAATALVVALFMAAVLATATASLTAIGREQHRFESAAAAESAMTADSYGFARAHGALPAVVAAVRAARSGAAIPSGLTPPIGQLRNVPSLYRPPAGCILRDMDNATTGKVCRIGRPSSQRVIVLLGDSHANMWLPPLLEMARHDGWAVVPLVRLGCTPATWVTNLRGCRDWYRWALAETISLHPDVTLLGGSIDQRPTPATRTAMESVLETARALEAAGRRVVLIGDPEGLRSNPVDCLLARHATMATCTTTWPRSSLAAYDEMQRRVKQLGVGFLPTRQFVSFKHAYPAVIGHTIAWMDNSHLTVAYSTQIAAPFRAALVDVLRKDRR